MSNRILHLIAAFIVAIGLIGIAPQAAFAFDGSGEGAAPPETASQGEDTTEPETPTPAEPVALTPDGNLTLVDDISGEQATDKQFITVITKGGNYFYLVIDRAGDSENVYFLNLVDESDLMALLEDAETSATTPPAVTQPEQAPVTVEPEPVAEPQEDSGGNLGMILGIVALLALIGGGVLFYIKVLKPKRSSSSGRVDVSELDGYGYGADEDLDDLISDDGYLDEPDDSTGEDAVFEPDTEVDR